MKIILSMLMLLSLNACAMNEMSPQGIADSKEMSDGMIHVESQFSVKQTADRLQTLLSKKGMKIFNRINHAQGAKSVGIELRPTELIIFGNPKAGSPLMQCAQTMALDLPQKALVWQDEAGKVWITYNDPAYLQARHNVKGCDTNFAKIKQVLNGLTKAAAQDDLIIQLN